MKKVASCFLIISLICLAFLPAYAAGKIDIVCTSFPCYDFARAVAGECANVRMLMKPGMEVHSYEPTPSDVMAIADCDLFVYIGGESDAWVEDILDSFGADAPVCLKMFDSVEHICEAGHDAHAGHVHEYDEHIWTAPMNAADMVNAVCNVLAQLDAENADAYARNAEVYIRQINALDAQIREIVDGAARREMVFADRFPFVYFAQAYGIEYHAAFPTCSSEGEPSAKTIAELIMKIIQDDIPVVYTIEMSNGKVGRTLQEETGVDVLTFHSMQTVTEAEFAAGETYITIMQKNIKALQEGLN